MVGAELYIFNLVVVWLYIAFIGRRAFPVLFPLGTESQEAEAEDEVGGVLLGDA